MSLQIDTFQELKLCLQPEEWPVALQDPFFKDFLNKNEFQRAYDRFVDLASDQDVAKLVSAEGEFTKPLRVLAIQQNLKHIKVMASVAESLRSVPEIPVNYLQVMLEGYIAESNFGMMLSILAKHGLVTYVSPTVVRYNTAFDKLYNVSAVPIREDQLQVMESDSFYYLQQN